VPVNPRHEPRLRRLITRVEKPENFHKALDIKPERLSTIGLRGGGGVYPEAAGGAADRQDRLLALKWDDPPETTKQIRE
jgi:hypothetical protein